VLLVTVVVLLCGATDSVYAVAPSPGERLGPRPPIAKVCGSIQVNGKPLRVDITETIGMEARGCGTAREVMRRFVRRSPEPMDDGEVRYRGRKYDCYRSRPDGEGWEYHCSWSKFNGDTNRFIDFGAGRRF
jgi:hypothetical protein